MRIAGTLQVSAGIPSGNVLSQVVRSSMNMIGMKILKKRIEIHVLILLSLFSNAVLLEFTY